MIENKLMIKAILFDLDNTLIDRQRAFKEMLYRTFSKYYNDDKYIEVLVNDMLEFDKSGAVERIEAFTKLINKYQIKEFTAEELSLNWSKESGNVVYLFDDVLDTLKMLKNKYKLAIVTNGNYASQKRKLDNVNLYGLLDYCLISDEIGIRKPDPRIFKYACEKLNLKESECLYVGDSYSRDIVGALNAGLDAIYVSRNNQIHEDVKTIYQIKELADILI